ncbi:hypothetical protein IWQ62_001040 [Dispira parvispora]|uniref:AB hydrolase-1 domain-containing protein n=1 Tax=Dispira parvispora TaxID=1520584 RepID=A0A9W8AX20_9FUNG|nr:hypothetical protein IWQ62_001040 [Dispira parvispora]
MSVQEAPVLADDQVFGPFIQLVTKDTLVLALTVAVVLGTMNWLFSRFGKETSPLVRIYHHANSLDVVLHNSTDTENGDKISDPTSCVSSSSSSTRKAIPEGPPCVTTLQHVLKQYCPTLTDPEKAVFRPSRWLFNGHLQTAAVTRMAFRTGYEVDYHRELVPLPDGGSVALDWYPSTDDVPNGQESRQPIVLIMHGLTGGSHEFYVRALIKKLMADPQLSYRTVVMNNRGCGFSELLTPQLYSAGYTDDLRHVVRQIHSRYPHAPLVGVGFSLGSNILVKYIGEEGDQCKFAGAVSVGNPFNLLQTSDTLHDEGIMGPLVYTRVMRGNLVRALMRHKHVFMGAGMDLDTVNKSRTVREFDELVTRRMFGYDTVKDYYVNASCAPYVSKVRVPLLCLQSEDDPICSAKSIPYEDCLNNPFIVLATTAHGGHLGWLEAGSQGNQVKPWTPEPIAEYISAILHIDHCLPQAKS